MKNMQDSQIKIGIIGLGAMGAPMARRLLVAGYAVYSCANQNRKAIEELSADGLIELSSPLEVGAEVDLLLSVVFNETQNDTILRGEHGAITALKAGSTIAVMSTLGPEYCKALAEECETKNIAVLDCPLSGLPAGARNGSLSLMIGGASETIERNRAPLETLGTVYHCGDVGAGQVVKLGNNSMFIGTLSLLLEVRDFVESQGVSFDTFKHVLNESTGRSFVSQHIPLPPKEKLAQPMPQKDVSRLLTAAREHGVDTPMLDLCFNEVLKGELESIR